MSLLDYPTDQLSLKLQLLNFILISYILNVVFGIFITIVVLAFGGYIILVKEPNTETSDKSNRPNNNTTNV